MAIPSSHREVTKSGILVLSLAIFSFWIGAVFGTSILRNAHFAIPQVVIYAGLVAAVAGNLWTCLRLSQGSEYSSMLRAITFWIILAVLSGSYRFLEVFDAVQLYILQDPRLVTRQVRENMVSENRDYIWMATNVAVYVALFWSLRLVKQMLERELPRRGT